jgi:hypothetical protein
MFFFLKIAYNNVSPKCSLVEKGEKMVRCLIFGLLKVHFVHKLKFLHFDH